jgi:uncharacterized YigZ family protein
MKTIKETMIVSETIKKSIFTCHLFPIESQNDAKKKLEALKLAYPDATHHCYAYILGTNQAIYKYDDDNEPHQTAGVVIYDVLRKNELSNCMAVVIRYFGCIKLGTGGLARAYRMVSAKAVKEAITMPLVEWITFGLRCRYEDWPMVERRCTPSQIIEKTFDEGVSCFVRVEKTDQGVLIHDLIELTKNTIEFFPFSKGDD